MDVCFRSSWKCSSSIYYRHDGCTVGDREFTTFVRIPKFFFNFIDSLKSKKIALQPFRDDDYCRHRLVYCTQDSTYRTLRFVIYLGSVIHVFFFFLEGSRPWLQLCSISNKKNLCIDRSLVGIMT